MPVSVPRSVPTTITFTYKYSLINRKTYNEDGVGGMHVYSPWWLDNKNLDFARGYHIEVWGGLGAPSYGTGFNVNSFN